MSPDQNGHVDPFAPAPEVPAYADGLRWYTIREAADLCHRQPPTIRTLVSRHRIPRKTAWVTRHRRRQRVSLLRPHDVVFLQRITLFGEKLRYPPTDHPR